MKEKELNEKLATVRLSELNRAIEQKELFESLRPRSFVPLLYILIMIVLAVLYIIFGGFSLSDDSVVTILFLLVFFQPLSVLQESRKINKRIDVLYELLKNKHFVGD